MKRLLIMFAWLLFAMPVFATELLETIGAERPIQLKSVRVQADISGQLAQTVYELTFYNPNARPLEGQLHFPLLAGQQISGFALDFNKEFRPAVPVDKAKGRQVFEETVRQKIDPALLENTAGNQFRLRVYPIPSLGERRVQITVSEALHGGSAGMLFRLPLQFAKGAADFRLSLDTQGLEAAPQAINTIGVLRFERIADRYHADTRTLALNPQGELALLIKPAQKPQVYTQTFDGDTYFIATIPVKPAKPIAREFSTKPVGLLWDSSSSGANRPLDKELALLDRYFKARAGQAQIEVRLQRLRDQPEAVEIYRIANGDWSKLRAALQGTVYDGATRMVFPVQADVGEYLLFSDGLVNYGEDRFPALAVDQQLFAISSAAGADTNRLAALANRTGGKLVDLTLGVDSAARALVQMETQLAASLQAEGVDQLVLRSPQPQDGQFFIAGRLTAPQGTVRGAYLPCSKCSTPLPIKIEVSRQPHDSTMVARLWAALQIGQLKAEPELNRGQIRRLGQRFGVPSSETSLIVLDRIEDYVRHDIQPPAALRADYDRLRAQRQQQRERVAQGQMDKLAAMFKARIAWWEKDFPKDAPPVQDKKQKIATGNAAFRESGDRVAEMVAPARSMAVAASPAPAPSAKAAGMSVAKEAVAESAPEIGISLRKWTPDTPYLKRMKNADDKDLYRIYLDEKPSWANSSAFYLDVADLFVERGQKALAFRILSNLAEMDLENRQVLRLLAYRLVQWKAPALAVPVLREVQRLSEEEPQSFRDLALAYAAAGQHRLAVEQFMEVLQRAWDGRFAEIDLVALGELNALLAAHPELNASGIDPRLIRNLPLDLRAVLSWDADNSDMDLWITDPNGEKCYYGHRDTYQGGHMSRDFTGGYGPEEFLLKKAKPGKYKVEANFYGNRQQVVAGATSLQLNLFTAYATPRQKEESVTLRLKGNGQTVFVGEFEVK